MKPENRYIGSVHRLLPVEIHRWKINARFQNGVPDCWYSGDRADLWIEYKWVEKFPKMVQPHLSSLQTTWLNKREHEGRKVAVIIGSPAGAVLIERGAWNAPLELKKLTLWSKEQIAGWIISKVIR